MSRTTCGVCHYNRWKCTCPSGGHFDNEPTLGSLMPLYQAIKHGSAAHRQWLWDAIVAWSNNKEVPPPYE